MPDHTKLFATPIHQDSILLRGPSGLPKIRDRGDSDVLCIAYSLSRINSVGGSKHEMRDPNEDAASKDEIADGDGEAYKLWPRNHFYSDSQKMQIQDTDFPNLYRNQYVPLAGRDPFTPLNSPIGSENIRILDFKGCSAETAGELVAAMADRPSPPDAPVLDITGLEHRNRISEALAKKVRHIDPADLYGFITGISLRAAYGQHQFLTLFISIPHLGLGRDTGAGGRSKPWNSETTAEEVGNRMEGSRTLREYRVQQIAEEDMSSRETILVHQTWFFVFDNVNIAIFRSRDDGASDLAPLYPYQQRVGVFQALVNMISNTMTLSEEAALRKCEAVIAEIELQIHEQIQINEMRAKGEIGGDDRASWHGTEKLINDFERHVLDVSTMMKVVRSQIRYLGQLERIFQNPFGNTVGHPRPHKNSFKIPHIHGQREEMIAVIATLKSMVEERESFFKELGIWESDLKLARMLFMERNERLSAISREKVTTNIQSLAINGTGIQAELMSKAIESQNIFIEEAGKKAEVVTEVIKKQGQTITLFTLITTIFLPLGFFCSYFAINYGPMAPAIKSTTEFWRIAGPITGALTLFMTVFVYTSDDRIRRYFVNFGNFLRRLVCLPPRAPQKLDEEGDGGIGVAIIGAST